MTETFHPAPPLTTVAKPRGAWLELMLAAQRHGLRRLARQIREQVLAARGSARPQTTQAAYLTDAELAELREVETELWGIRYRASVDPAPSRS